MYINIIILYYSVSKNDKKRQKNQRKVNQIGATQKAKNTDI